MPSDLYILHSERERKRERDIYIIFKCAHLELSFSPWGEETNPHGQGDKSLHLNKKKRIYVGDLHKIDRYKTEPLHLQIILQASLKCIRLRTTFIHFKIIIFSSISSKVPEPWPSPPPCRWNSGPGTPTPLWQPFKLHKSQQY